MAATLLSTIITQARQKLGELTPRFWSADELTSIMTLGIQDLWGAIIDLHQDHFVKISTVPVLAADATEITGIPEDCFRVQLIEPADTTASGSARAVLFSPRKYNHPDFIAARTQASTDPSIAPTQVYFQVTGLGPPIEAPKILTAPKVSSAISLRLVYNPSVEIADYNPIPGNSDNALKAWVIAYAVAKEREDGAPDAGWLGVYAAEKQNILIRLTPRQEQEPEVVEDLFQGYGSFW